MKDSNTYIRVFNEDGVVLGSALLTDNYGENRVTIKKSGVIVEMRIQNDLLELDRAAPSIKGMFDAPITRVEKGENVWLSPLKEKFIQVD